MPPEFVWTRFPTIRASSLVDSKETPVVLFEKISLGDLMGRLFHDAHCIKTDLFEVGRKLFIKHTVGFEIDGVFLDTEVGRHDGRHRLHSNQYTIIARRGKE